MIKKVSVSSKDKKHISSLRIDPATLADDFFDYSKVVIKKPWGQEYLAFRNENVAVWVLNIKHGHKTSMHCHPNKKTSIVALSGEARCSTLNSSEVVTAGRGFLIDKGVFHSTEALSPEGIVVMETETPTNKRDLIRLRDEYGREGTAYEGSAHYAVLDDSLCHFHKETERHHCGKKFGDCEMMIVRHNDLDGFRKTCEQFGAEIVAVLGGKLLDGQRTCIAEIGDVLSWQELVSAGIAGHNSEIETLLIRKYPNA